MRIGHGLLGFTLLVLNIAIFAGILAPPPASAGRKDILPNEGTILPLISRAVALGPSQSVTSDIKAIYFGENQGLSIDLSGGDGSPIIVVQVLQSNVKTGPMRLWSNPTAAGSSVTNRITFTADHDGSDLALVPSGYAQFVYTNSDSTTVTLDRSDLLNQ